MNPADLYYKSFQYLHDGDYQTGFSMFENRWHPETLNSFPAQFRPKKLTPQKPWRGESLLNKTVTVQMEMGYGDCIMFARFLPLLKAYGAHKVVLLQTKTLHNLMSQFKCVDYLSNDDKTGAAVQTDYWIGSMSLAHLALNASLSTRYLFPINKDFVVGKHGYMNAIPFPMERKINIGINWEAARSGYLYTEKSYEVSFVESLINRFPEINFYSFNTYTDGPCKPLPTTDWKDDWSITARYMKSMNLMITIDTGTAHLAGALNVPCLVMLPSEPHICWRWKFNNWYNSTNLFVQPDTETIISYLQERINGNNLYVDN